MFASLNIIIMYDLNYVSNSYGDAINKYLIQLCVWMVKCKHKHKTDLSVCKAASTPDFNKGFDLINVINFTVSANTS